jgi:hypothetical protein
MAMNDDDLLTAVRDRFDSVRMDTPAAAIMARGRALRRHRSSGRLAAGALAVSLGAGLAVPALTAGPTGATGPAGAAGTPGSPHQATLAAWTVQKHSDGSIAVTIRRPENLAALRLKLAKLGVTVVFADEPAKLAHGCAFHVQLKKLARPFTFVIKPTHVRPATFIPPKAALPHSIVFIGAKPSGAIVKSFAVAIAACPATR